MLNLTVLDWTYKLQHELDKMDSNQLNEFMKGKAIRYEGKLYTIGVENEKPAKRKNSKVKRKASGTVKRSDNESKNIRAN